MIGSRNDSVNASAPSSVTGNGLTWVQVATVAFDTAGAIRSTLTLLRALGAAPSAGAVTINFAATHHSSSWSVIEFSGVDTGGTDGSAAVVQSVTDLSASDADGILSVALAAFGSANNATYGMFGSNGSAGFTPGLGFTEIHDVPQATSPTSVLMTEFRVDNDTSVDATRDGGSALDLGGIAVEIKAGASAFALDAAPGSYAITGVAAALPATRLFNVDPGVYTLAGFAAELVTGVLGAYTLDAVTGSYTLTGVATSPIATRLFNLAPGSYLLTGVSTQLTVGSALLSLIDHTGSTLTLVDHPETH